MNDLYKALYTNDVVRLGKFTLKSGHTSPIYIDFRHVQSQPQINEIICTALASKVAELREKYDFICGVPIGASHYASVVGWKNNVGVLTYRKDVKAHGTKKVVEGTYEKGQRVLLIEDVVTTGNSIVDAAKAICAQGLVITDVVVLLDREQGARENLTAHGITMHNLWSMDGLLSYLTWANAMQKDLADEVRVQMKAMMKPNNNLPVIDAKKWELEARCEEEGAHLQARRLLKVMQGKKSNLCVALDYDNFAKIMKVAKEIAPHIAALKVHADFIVDFSIDEMKELRALADEMFFVLIEDRKLADTATTVIGQLEGVTRPTEWAHLITVHGVQGNALFEGARKVPRIADGRCGLLIVAEMSTKGSLTQLPGYTKACVEQATTNEDIVAGFICQTRCSSDPRFVYLTPGVNRASVKLDNQGQQFRTASTAIGEQLNDVVIVGRGVTQPGEGVNLVDAALAFKEEAWNARK